MIKYLILSLALLVVLPSVYADWPFSDPIPLETEIGYDYSRTKIGDNTYLWVSSPPRLEDYPNHFVNYRYTENENMFKFESAQAAVRFNKETCTIRLYDDGVIQNENDILVNSISSTLKEAAMGNDNWYDSTINDQVCQTSYETSEDGIQYILKKAPIVGPNFETIYDIKYDGTIKVTYRYYNGDLSKTNHKYGFVQSFDGAFKVQVGEQVYDTSIIPNEITITRDDIGDNIITISRNGFTISYDPQNYIHNYLWALKIKPNHINFDFTNAQESLPVGATLEIDPTFGYATATQYEAFSNQAGTADNSCNHATYGKTSNGVRILKRANTSTSECYAQAWQWNVSTIPDTATITNSTLRYDVDTVSTPLNCDFTQVTNDITSASGQAVWDDVVGVTSDVDYVPNQTGCTTVANDKTLNLGTTFNSYLQSTGLGVDRIAVGSFFNNQVRDASTHTVTVSNTVELRVVYTLPQVTLQLKPTRSDGSTVIGTGYVNRVNATNFEQKVINSTGWVKFSDIVTETNYNYTVKDATDNFVVNRTINKNMLASQDATAATNIYDISCPALADSDWQIKANATSYHNATFWTAPSCDSEGDITFQVRFIKAGLGPSTNQTTKVIARSLDLTEYDWCPSNVLANGTAATWSCSTVGGGVVFNGTNIQVANGYNSVRISFRVITDNVTSAPTVLSATPTSETKVNLSWTAPGSTHGSAIQSYRIWRDGSVYVNSTGSTATTYTDNAAGPGGTSHTYLVCAWNRIGCSPYSNSATATTYTFTTGTITIVSGNVGDVTNINATITITAGSPAPFTIQDVGLYRNNTLVQTNGTDLTVSVVGGTAFERIWYQITNDDLNIFHVRATVTNATGTVSLSSTNTNVTREYDPSYVNALEDFATNGRVNNTVARFDDSDGVLLKVNRVDVATGSTWHISCIAQTNQQAANTKNSTENWEGIWRNQSSTGYFNATWVDFVNSHAYITCFNDGLLFTTTSYTNSSLALFGIQIFDDSYGAMLGVPVGIFFLAMAGSMANKRTAPTWIIVVLGMAGTMAAIGFFTLEPLVWGLALVAGLLGVLVNQKVF